MLCETTPVADWQWACACVGGPFSLPMPNAFAIVTPVLNGWPRLRAAVASVAAQRVEGLGVRHVVQLHEDSSDEGRAWLAEQPGIELRVSRDSGIYDAIGRGLADAREPYLGWLNADEQYLPGTLARAAAVLTERPGVGAVFGDYLLLDREGGLAAARREIPARRWYLRHGVNYILSCATFFRREVWEELGGLSRDYARLADKEFYLRALDRGVRFLHVPEYWGVYGLTGANLSTDELGQTEPERLRRQVGAYRSATARRIPRACRCVEKYIQGCYGRRQIAVSLFGDDGERRAAVAVVGTRWRWS
jgi:hypothetical protein